jgi:peptide/nickel transport system permease protein
MGRLAPRCIVPLLVIPSFNLGTAIFCRRGIELPGASVSRHRRQPGEAFSAVCWPRRSGPPWWLVVFPGSAITLSIGAANLNGDVLRDFLDPRLEQQVE